MNAVSIFNDVVGPVMRGPSSSHCAAALRIGRLARDLMDGQIDEVLVEFDVHGSLPTTHDSQGSDMGLFGGLLGWEADDERLPQSEQFLQQAGVKIRFVTIDVNDPHPNTYRLTLKNQNDSHSMIAISTGGGMIEVLSVDGIALNMDGGFCETLLWVNELPTGSFDPLETIVHKTSDGFLVQVKGLRFVSDEELSSWNPNKTKRLHRVLPVPSFREMQLPFQSSQEMVALDGSNSTPLWKLAIAYEMARSQWTENEVLAQMIKIVQLLRRSIQRGLQGTFYEDRVLGYQSGGFKKLMDEGRLLNAGALNRIVLYVTAMMEVKSSMGVIVAAPTAGACAALPGAVLGMGEELGSSDEELAKAMLAAGLIGTFIATRWTFAAEVGGCQAEGGSAASMSAAALVTLAQGTRDQALAAASMAMQSMLGLICDPIANRVEAPCLGKNVMAASNALSCANMALAGYDPLIPLDEVIDAAKAVSARMPREHRCTSLGGLAVTPTSLAIEKRLIAIKSKSCGSNCACS